VRGALEAVTTTFERYVPAVLAAGAEGIYLATVDWAARDLMSADEYRSWARPYDERILAAAAQARFNVLHVCRTNTLLPELSDYPVAAFSWAAGEPGNLTLAEGLERFRGAAMGGIPHEGALQRDEPDAVLRALHDGFEQTGGRRWLIAPSCSIPPTTLPEQLQRLRTAVDRFPSTSAPR
jgi:uroporphyrinogen-III decarboxylase